MPLPECQQEVGAFLGLLAGGPPIETHISAVFVGGNQVWKLKKAVRLSFLDFSAVEARHHFLGRELALNEPHAPGIYRDVVAIERTVGGALTLRPEEESRAALDWVLRMARIPEHDFLDKVAGRGDLGPALLDALGDCVAHDHVMRPTASLADAAGSLRKIALGAAESAQSAGLDRGTVVRWRTDISYKLDTLAEWLNERARAGFVRRCHGDLHLGNMCLWQGTPVPFDALEFDEDLATIDVGYDLAFLVMDIDCRVGRPEANRLLNRYLARTGDVGLVRGLPAFLSMRAMVRAYVEAASGKTGDVVARYLSASLAYLQPAPPMLVAIGGLPGSGKSTHARLLAPNLGRPPGAVIMRSDEVRKRRFGVSPEGRLPPTAYAPSVDVSIAAELVALSRMAAKDGYAVIADATFADPALRAKIAQAAAGAGVPFVGIWLTAPLSALEQRIAGRRGDASDADVRVLHAMACELAEPTQTTGWLIVEASDRQQAASRIAQAVAAARLPRAA